MYDFVVIFCSQPPSDLSLLVRSNYKKGDTGPYQKIVSITRKVTRKMNGRIGKTKKGDKTDEQHN